MKTRPLGKTGLQVSELAMGGLFVASWFGDLEQARNGTPCDRAGRQLHRHRARATATARRCWARRSRISTPPLILSTKLGGRPQPFRPRDRADLLASVEESLRLLERDRVDILMIHEPDRLDQYDWWTDWEHFTGPVLDVLDQLKRDDVIRFTGLGRTTAYSAAHHRHGPVRRRAHRIQLQPALKRGGDCRAACREGAGYGHHHRLPLARRRRWPDAMTMGWWRRVGSARRGGGNTYQALYALLDDLAMPIAGCAPLRHLEPRYLLHADGRAVRRRGRAERRRSRKGSLAR